MTRARKGDTKKEHDNAFGLLRLTLACLVIVAHAPELTFGNREAELLTKTFGTISFGDLAVDGFFIISGYLIGLSYLRDPRPGPYLLKRLARIFPAYFVSYLICTIIVLPMAGGEPPGLAAAPRVIFDWITIQPPRFAAFKGTYFPALNGPMWSLAYEFRYYVAVIALGTLKMLARPIFSVILFGLFVISGLAVRIGLLGDVDDGVGGVAAAIFGLPSLTIRLGMMFTAGLCLIHIGRFLPRSKSAILICFMLLLLGLRSKWFVDLNVALFGSLLIFMLSFYLSGTGLSAINRKNDISYGAYLYAWPISKLILWHYPTTSVLVLTLWTAAASLLAGGFSWFAVERPAIAYMKRRLDRLRRRGNIDSAWHVDGEAKRN